MSKNFKILRKLIIRHYKVDVKENNRNREIVDAKKIFCLIAYENVNHASYQKIALFLKRKNHATILHHVNTARGLIKVDKDFREFYEKIKYEFFLLNKDVLISEITSEIYLLKKRLKFLKNKKKEFKNIKNNNALICQE